MKETLLTKYVEQLLFDKFDLLSHELKIKIEFLKHNNRDILDHLISHDKIHSFRVVDSQIDITFEEDKKYVKWLRFEKLKEIRNERQS